MLNFTSGFRLIPATFSVLMLAAGCGSDSTKPAAKSGLDEPKDSLAYAMAACPSGITTERSDLVRVDPKSLFDGRPGTYRLKRMRGYIAGNLSQNASRANDYKTVRESGAAMIELVPTGQGSANSSYTTNEVCRYATSDMSLKGTLNANTWVDRADSYTDQAVSVALRVTDTELSKTIAIQNQEAYLNTQADSGGAKTNAYALAAGGFLITTAFEQVSGDSKIVMHIETEYEVSSEVRKENLDAFIGYFTGLNGQAYPHNAVVSATEATQYARTVFNSGVSLRQAKKILGWAASLNNQAYPHDSLFPNAAYLKLGMALIAQPNLDFAKLQARTKAYLEMNERDYPHNSVFPGASAVREAFKEMNISIDLQRL